ncbi:alpha/beta hydrolase [Halonotius terrestris]|uniref:Alpha/beta hydrolase n=1 Tax=Halonotius terrestris TaxID=2487750 RepID=A0A8J8PD91_9EURY|nr:alpha/beta hydrolase [Halonotius terrestris]TQQ82898.1 alpha/beta hydrolase [Halonotius terrestris]
MPTVSSADGTEIAHEQHGDGPPLIALHGSAATGESLQPIVAKLAPDYTVTVPERRGRGASGDGDDYSLDREIEDLHAIVDAVDGDPVVLAHSFGGLVALAAAPDLDLSRLVLYEPAITVGDPPETPLSVQVQSLAEDANKTEAMQLFFEAGSGIPDVTAMPWWPEHVNMDWIDTVIRELQAVEAFELPALDFETPTLLLTGEHGPEHLAAGARAVNDAHPNSRLVEVEGVGHLGLLADPEQVATLLQTFVDDPDAVSQ